MSVKWNHTANGHHRHQSLAEFSYVCLPFQIPDSGLTYLSERILLFVHDYSSPNVLHIINSAAEVVDETLVEIVLTASRK